MKIAGLFLFVFMLSLSVTAGESRAESPSALLDIAKAVNAEFDRMDRAVAGAAKELSGTDMNGAGARRMLRDLCRAHPYAVDCAVVDRSGRMVIVEPEEFSKFEGADISGQEQVVRLRKTGRPVLSNTFKTVEGMDAVDLEHPLFTPSGELAGSLSMLIRPEALFAHVLVPVQTGLPVEVFVMQTDGRIIYDADRDEIGRMLFDDPLYRPFPELIETGRKAAGERTGAGSYEFRQAGSEKLVRKDAYWSTVGLHGTEWRLVVMHVRTAPRDGAVNPEAAAQADALRTLAGTADVASALAANDAVRVRRILMDFHARYPEIYSVQWLDAGGINRCGYPEENSLINFDMKTMRTASSKPMLEALMKRQESSFESPLAEGKTGIFFMVPAYNGSEYLGMIYTIRLKRQ